MKKITPFAGNSKKIEDLACIYAVYFDDLLQSYVSNSPPNQEKINADKQLDIIMKGIETTAHFLENLGKELGNENIYLPLAPLIRAIEEYQKTGSTPSMFKAKTKNRPETFGNKLQLKVLAIVFLELYIANTSANKHLAEKRVINIYRQYSKDLKINSSRTLREWKKNCKPNQKWHEDYCILKKSIKAALNETALAQLPEGFSNLFDINTAVFASEADQQLDTRLKNYIKYLSQ